MRRILLLLIAVISVNMASAQTLQDIFKGAVTNIVDSVTDGKATEYMLPGTWNYTSPAIRLSSDSEILSNVASATLTSGLESKLVKAYSLVGFKSGASSFTFKEDNTFTAVIGKRTLSGTYTYDSATHRLSMTFSTLLKLGNLNGYAYINGESLELVFDCSRVMDLLVSLGSKMSSLKGITSIAGQFDSMMVGFEYNK